MVEGNESDFRKLYCALFVIPNACDESNLVEIDHLRSE